MSVKACRKLIHSVYGGFWMHLACVCRVLRTDARKNKCHRNHWEMKETIIEESGQLFSVCIVAARQYCNKCSYACLCRGAAPELCPLSTATVMHTEKETFKGSFQVCIYWRMGNPFFQSKAQTKRVKIIIDYFLLYITTIFLPIFFFLSSLTSS